MSSSEGDEGLSQGSHGDWKTSKHTKLAKNQGILLLVMESYQFCPQIV